MNRRDSIGLLLASCVLFVGCASWRAHLEAKGCTIDGPLTFTCPWEMRR